MFIVHISWANIPYTLNIYMFKLYGILAQYICTIKFPAHFRLYIFVNNVLKHYIIIRNYLYVLFLFNNTINIVYYIYIYII